MTEPECPSCHTALQRATGASGLRFQCPTCNGVIIGLAVFRHLLPADVGSQVWVASAAVAPESAPCGFCARPMRSTAVASDGGPQALVGVCRACEAIWIPSDQATLLPIQRGATGGSLAEPLPAPPPTRCPECGAPFAVAADGCCPFCHRRVEVPQTVVVLHDGDGNSPGDAGTMVMRALGGAAGYALRGLLGG